MFVFGPCCTHTHTHVDTLLCNLIWHLRFGSGHILQDWQNQNSLCVITYSRLLCTAACIVSHNIQLNYNMARLDLSSNVEDWYFCITVNLFTSTRIKITRAERRM